MIVTPELQASLDKLTSMDAPPVDGLLRRLGYHNEADVVRAVVLAWRHVKDLTVPSEKQK